MGHLKYDSATGHLLYGSNGHLVHTCTPDNPNPCSTCDDGSPYNIAVTFSGITICECLHDLDNIWFKFEWNNFNGAGVIELAPHPTLSCRWYAIVEDAVDVIQYPAVSSATPRCDQTPDASYTLDLLVVVFLQAADLVGVYAELNKDGVSEFGSPPSLPSLSLGLQPFKAFEGSFTATTGGADMLCQNFASNNEDSASNDNTFCVDENSYFAYDGTATVSNV